MDEPHEHRLVDHAGVDPGQNLVEFGGIGAEISSQVQEQAFDWLDAPVARLAAPFAPVPYAPVLENAYVPDAPRIEAAVRRLLERR